ncbi:Protein of unknown function [Propionibacterium freudenreichii]|nr:Protein of unknown function [Propionibacterium freudenreichii]CEI49715.1 Protein of unknown function [Propionibacterium freudenreichii]
MKFEHGPSE